MSVMRFYADENIAPGITAAARALGLDITDSHECGMNGTDDDLLQLRFAAGENRCMITTDRDFIGLSRVAAQAGERHAGVLMLPSPLRRQDFAAFARGLARFAAEHADGLLPYQVLWFPESEWRER